MKLRRYGLVVVVEACEFFLVDCDVVVVVLRGRVVLVVLRGVDVVVSRGR